MAGDFTPAAKRVSAQMRVEPRCKVTATNTPSEKPAMNTLTNQFPTLYTGLHNQIVKVMTEQNEPALPPAPTERKTLRGYDFLMRQHATACEAWR